MGNIQILVHIIVGKWDLLVHVELVRRQVLVIVLICIELRKNSRDLVLIHQVNAALILLQSVLKCAGIHRLMVNIHASIVTAMRVPTPV